MRGVYKRQTVYRRIDAAPTSRFSGILCPAPIESENSPRARIVQKLSFEAFRALLDDDQF